MKLVFEAHAEDLPGVTWATLFRRLWPAYRGWFLSEGITARPTYSQAMAMLRRHMPEILPTYERLCELAGGSDLAARFLSLYRPPAFMSGCSQAVWTDGEPVLIRNYDYSPYLCDALVLNTRWNGRRVIAMSDCLWGCLDGINEDGLAVSLTFGGRQAVGDGFGIPIVLRYLLETCSSAAEAAAALRRIPTHMSYNVTALDRSGTYFTAELAPDRSPVVYQKPIATNHQGAIEWHHHARVTATLERERFLGAHLAEAPDAPPTAEAFAELFLHPPLYATAYGRGFGTLYTAVYRPARGEAEFLWPGVSWRQSLARFEEGAREVRLLAQPLATGFS